ncbi:MAG: methionyl-tRNA formyltransferase [Solirubrobacterales bacterium]
MSQGVFLGTSDFAATVLRRLAGSEYCPELVVTLPDRKRGRGRRLQPSSVAATAEEAGIEILKSANVNADEDRERILKVGGAWASICAFGQIIKEPLLSELPMLNVHPSLLPRWRGAAPIERAIMAGDQETGVCVMKLVAGLDSGPVALRRSITVGVEENYEQISARLADLGGEMLVEALELSGDGGLEWVEQSDEGLTYAEKIESSERRVDPTMAVCPINDMIRALTPHIGAFIELEGGERLGVRQASPAGEGLFPELSSGKFTEDEGRLYFGCSDGALELLVVQPAGGKAMDAGSYLRGRGLPAALA